MSKKLSSYRITIFVTVLLFEENKTLKSHKNVAL